MVKSQQQTGQPIQPKRSKWLSFLNFILNLVIIALIVFFVRAYIIAPFQVSGASMTDTLDSNEYIIVNKLLYHGLLGLHVGKPERGDIVVIEPPIERKMYYIKRIIGLPGETVILDGDKVTIKNQEYPDGFVLHEDYLKCVEIIDNVERNTCSYSKLDRKEFVVPENSYFVMGDNRNNSTDSRVCFQSCKAPNATPFVTLDHIVGKTMFVIWPLNHLRFLPNTNYSAAPATS